MFIKKKNVYVRAWYAFITLIYSEISSFVFGITQKNEKNEFACFFGALLRLFFFTLILWLILNSARSV